MKQLDCATLLQGRTGEYRMIFSRWLLKIKWVVWIRFGLNAHTKAKLTKQLHGISRSSRLFGFWPSWIYFAVYNCHLFVCTRLLWLHLQVFSLYSQPISRIPVGNDFAAFSYYFICLCNQWMACCTNTTAISWCVLYMFANEVRLLHFSCTIILT